MLNKLLKYAPVQMFSALSVFALIALQTKYLNVEAYGILAIFMLITEVTRSFSMQWITNSIVRLYPSQTTKVKAKYLAAAINILIILFIPALALIAIGVFYYELFGAGVFILLAGFLLIKTIYLFFINIARLDDRVNLYRNASLAQSISAVIFTLLLLNASATITDAIIALIVSYLLPAPFLLKNIKLNFKTNKKTYKGLIQYGSPLLLSGVFSLLSSRADRIFISDGMTMADLGVYSGLSNLLFGIMALVFMIVAMPLYPELTKAIGDDGKLNTLHKKYLNVLLIITLPAFLGICLVAEFLIPLFLTASYLTHGIELFYVLAVSVFLMNIRAHYIDHGLQFTLNTKFMPAITMVGMALNIVLLVLLIEPYGLYGAAWAALITNLITAIISFLTSIKLGYKYTVDRNVLKTVCASFVMLICIYAAKELISGLEVLYQLIILIALGVVTYALAQIAFNTLNVRTSLNRWLYDH